MSDQPTVPHVRRTRAYFARVEAWHHAPYQRYASCAACGVLANVAGTGPHRMRCLECAERNRPVRR